MSKIVAAVPRVVLGGVLFLFGLAGLFHLIPPQPMEGAGGTLMAGLGGSYVMTLVKLTEVVAGALLLSNRFVPLALAIIAPVLVNIAAFHLFYAPAGLAVPIVLIAAELWLVRKNWAAFAPMLVAGAPQVRAASGRAIAA